MQRRTSASLHGLLLIAALTGCTGSILDGSGSKRDGEGATSGGKDVGLAPNEPAGSGGSGSGAGTTGAGNVDWTMKGEVTPGASYLRRLTNAEYNSTLHDLLQESGEVADRAGEFGFVPDTRVLGFESNATNVTMSSVVLERFRDAAEAVADSVVTDAETRARVLGCDLETDGDECTGAFIDAFGRAAYRRSLREEERQQLEDLAGAAPDALEGVRRVIEHVLLSPNFLFRIEEGVEDDGRPELVRLTGHEIGTRLSYLLLGTTPSDALLDAADEGALDDVAGVEATARALLEDPRAQTAVRRFYEQWFRLDSIENRKPNADLFPEFDAELAAAMREESSRLLENLIWQPGKNFLDFVSSPTTFVNERLAAFYGMPAVSGWQEVAYPDGTGRLGLLGHASVLLLTSHSDRASIVLRGKFVRELLLCHEMPHLPANVPALPVPADGQTEQDVLAQHAADPVCAGCHELMDPLGMGLAQFDAIGRFQSAGPSGEAIPTSGKIAGYSDMADPEFDGPVELAARLRELPQLSQCVVTQVFRHAFARAEEPEDGPLFSSVLTRFSESGHDFKELIVAFVTSDAFRYRERATDQGDWK